MNENDVEVKKEVVFKDEKALVDNVDINNSVFNVIDLWVKIIFYSFLVSSGLAVIAFFVSIIFCIFNGESVLC